MTVFAMIENRTMRKSELIQWIHENRCVGYGYLNGNLVSEHRVQGPFKPKAIISYNVDSQGNWATVTKIEKMVDTRPSKVRY